MPLVTAEQLEEDIGPREQDELSKVLRQEFGRLDQRQITPVSLVWEVLETYINARDGESASELTCPLSIPSSKTPSGLDYLRLHAGSHSQRVITPKLTIKGNSTTTNPSASESRVCHQSKLHLLRNRS